MLFSIGQLQKTGPLCSLLNPACSQPGSQLSSHHWELRSSQPSQLTVTLNFSGVQSGDQRSPARDWVRLFPIAQAGTGGQTSRPCPYQSQWILGCPGCPSSLVWAKKTHNFFIRYRISIKNYISTNLLENYTSSKSFKKSQYNFSP